MPRRRSVLSAIVLWGTALVMLSAAGSAIAGSTSPPSSRSGQLRANQAPDGAVTAVVVKSWGSCSSNSLIWDDLNANWPAYGSIPISIDYAYPGLCSSSDDVTLSELEASGADVVILSDPSGGNAQWSSGDADALQQYANQGHTVIGTYLLLTWGSTDNRALAPVVGLDPTLTYLAALTTPTYRERDPSLPLFRDVGNPYVSNFDATQSPSDRVWSSNELTSASLVARTSDLMAAILVQQAGTARPYSSIYITSMPEYSGSEIDKQFFYNAIIFPAVG